MDVTQLKAIGNIQNKYLFHVNIPTMPLGVGVNNFEFLARTTTIPGKERKADIIRYMGGQYSLPHIKINPGTSEWTINILMDETHTVYDKLMKWFYAVEANSNGVAVQTIKTDAFVKLLGLDSSYTNKRFKVLGIFPTKIGDIAGLDQSATDGHVTFDITFSYDTLDFDINNSFNF